MRRCVVGGLLLVAWLSVHANALCSVQFVRKGENEIQILVDGKHFTSLLYNRADLVKPVFYPVYSSKGTLLVRGYPFLEVEGESRDHPHHAGIFFTYDDVNGVGFWNAPTPPPQILVKEFKRLQEGKSEGVLQFVAEWQAPDGRPLLREDRTVTVKRGKNWRALDFHMVVTAVDTTVRFGDTKEGMFALRVADWLRERGGTGRYLSSEGTETADLIWGRRAKWVALSGEKNGEKIVVAMFAHPASVNYPPYWHVRNYGLFSVNPLGQWRFQTDTGVENPQYLNLILKPGESATFRYQLVFYEGTLTKEQLDKLYQDWVGR
ncbi:MAG: PmoA family protein [candidate division KSB1 bacterium]|nr:PmoA family protein [candidate division KSB1 bacterium]